MEPIHLGLIGCGTVGTGVARILYSKKQLLSDRVGIPLNLKYVADLDTTSDRGVPFPPGVMIDDAWKVINDPEVDVVIEMIGGEDLALRLIETAIENGKHVVTANKALLAKHGNRLLEMAGAKGVDLAFEASVGGCMPIIKTLRESLVGNRVESMIGILNGTCNYILSRITDEGIQFREALSQAQAAGYAEADPELDIEGLDAAHKLAIITALAYGTPIDFDNIYIEGISRITPLDIQFAAQFGYRIKLLAISKDHGDTIEARVHPTMIPFDNILSNVNGTLNAITVTGDAVGDILLYGHGAGMMPTASAVIGDIVDIARNLAAKASGRLPLLACQPDKLRPKPIMPISQLVTHYYIRFEAKDQPGVLSRISGILGNCGISISSVHQKGRKSEGSVPVVMVTHFARESDVCQAMDEISSLDVIHGQPVVIRIENDNHLE